MSNIKAGYQLKILSWENDADNYKTWVESGLTEVEVKYLIKIAEMFKSKHNTVFPAFGNARTSDKTYDEIWEAFKQIPVPDGIRAEYIFNDIDDLLDGFVYDAIDTWNEGDMFRVFDRFIVNYVPVEIEIQNVTEKFKCN